MAGRRKGGGAVDINKGKLFCRVIVRLEVTIRHPEGDGVGVVDGDKKFTPASVRMIAPDGGIVCEHFEENVHTEFSILQAADQPAAGELSSACQC